MTARLAPEERTRRKDARLLGGAKRRKSTSPYYRRCKDGSCGRCISCTRKRQWAEGKYAHKARPEFPDAWRPEQDARLRELAGRLERRAIAAILTDEFGIPRTVHAVAVRARRLGVSLWQPGLSPEEIGPLFGVLPGTVRRWIRSGQLHGEQYTPANGVNVQSRVSEADLEAFVRGCPWAYDAARMRPGHRLRALAEVVQRADPYRGPAETAAALGLSIGMLHYWRQRGVIPMQRRYGYVRGKDFRFRLGDLDETLEAIEHARQAAATHQRLALHAGHQLWRERGNATHRGLDLGPRQRAAKERAA